MLTIETATMRIGQKMQKTELLADETAKSAAELFSEIVQAGSTFRNHEAAQFAQPALMRAQKALADLTAARGEIARVHASLLDARRITMSDADSITMTPAQEECPDWVIGPIGLETSEAA